MTESYRFIAFAFAWALFLTLVYFSVFRNDQSAAKKPQAKKKKNTPVKGIPRSTVLLLLAAVFILRTVIAYFGKSIAEADGVFSTLFAEHAFLSFPFAALGTFADVLAAFLLYDLGIKSEKLNAQSALTLSLLWAINPASVMGFASFSQTVSISLALLFCAVSFLLARKPALCWAAGVCLGLSLLLSSASLYFLPLVIIFAVMLLKDGDDRSKRSLAVLAPSVLIPAAGWVLLHRVLSFSFPPFSHWTAEPYRVPSLNAFNFYTLMDSWKESWHTSGSLSMTSHLFFLPVQVWGYLAFSLTLLFTVFFFLRLRSEKRIFLFWGLTTVSLALFMTGSEPLFLIAATLFFYADFALCGSPLSLLNAFLVSASTLINVGMVQSTQNASLFDSRISAQQSTAVFSALLLVAAWIISLCSVLLTPAPGTQRQSFVIRPLSSGKTRRMVLTDWILLALFTVAAVMGNLWHLGDKEAPSTAWSAADGRECVVETGQPADRMTYFLTLGETGQALNADLKVETSSDGSNWTELVSISEKGYSYTWYDHTLTNAAQYLRFTLGSEFMSVLEIGLWHGDQQVPVKVKSGPATAFDEPELAQYGKTYMNSMYFDEVYHGRTAYEVTRGINEYEWTHPPLGKLIMSLGIRAFGMTPFGWRFTGALFGALLVPLMYLFGKKLFARTLPAVGMAALMLFDNFRFAQNRIGTIDTYAVFFIILMYYFMYDFFTMDFTVETGLWKMWRPLLFSGIFFGLGCAAKWVGFYAGAGLAILFFTALYRMHKENAKLFGEVWGKTVGACVIFFVIIPFAIYYASYLPHLHLFGYRFSEFISQQQSIYRYHSKLESTHSYSSSWYMWPFMIRPVYMSSGGSGVASGFTTRIVGIGNPAIWWALLPAFVFFVFLTTKKLKDHRFPFLLIAFLAQYLPWVLISRTTYQYHFFASLPFLMAMLVYGFSWLRENFPRTRTVIIVYGALVIFAFVMLFPVVSGTPIPSDSRLFTLLRAFDTWNFF